MAVQRDWLEISSLNWVVSNMIGFLLDWGRAVWHMLNEAAFLFLIGLVLAGLLSLVLNTETMRRIVSGGRWRTVFRASLLGVPLPLCSCSVLPVATQLYRSGMDKGGVTAFLIATPESGFDSIMLTYSLTDPLLTVARPVTAFLTAFTAGMTQSKSDLQMMDTNDSSSCEDHCCNCPEETVSSKRIPIISRIISGIRYAFTDLFPDMAPYLLVGFLLAGLFESLFGSYLSDLPDFWKTGWLGYAGAVLFGLPLYICATASTPLAATLLGFGFSPGAVLVFLLVGPATNIASLAVVRQILGLQGVMRYLTAIVVVAVLCGMATDRLYSSLDMAALYQTAATEHTGSTLYLICAILLAGLIVYWTGRGYMRKAA